MPYYGSWKIDDLLTFACNMHSASTASESDADSVPTYRVYEDLTTAPLLTGSMAVQDDVNTIGFYSARITLSAANGFEKGKTYHIRVHGIVGGIAANESHIFQMEAEVSLTLAGVASIWDSLTTALGAVGSIGKLIVDNLNATISSRLASGSYTAPPSAASNAIAVWDRAMSGHTTAGTFGDKIRAHTAAVLEVLVAAGSSPTTVVLNGTTGIEGAPPSAIDDFYNGGVLVFLTGTLAKQRTSITDYNGTTKTLTVVALTGTPAAGDTAILV
jgi:hypothetical protein